MSRTVLIVDDNKVNRMILGRMLWNEYEIVEASNGQEALDILRRGPKKISAVLLDLIMPVMDGYEVLETMRDSIQLEQIPVIITTSSTEEKSEDRALALGANDYILKPYNPAIIRHRLRNTIKLREAAAIVSIIQRDKLTGLYNREAFFVKAEEMIALELPGYYVMACFDIDQFKVINDQYGSEKGDEILKQIAKIFREGFEPLGGICGRVMADNFAVLYPASLTDSDAVADIRRRVSRLDGSIDPISYSIGRYLVDDMTLSGSAMYDRAAIAEASVKARFDTRVAQYDESMRQTILREKEIVNSMNTALKTGQFEIWLQPQYNHSSGALIGAEALVRWRSPEKGLIPPYEFIPVFERNGFIYEMDKYVWERTCVCLRQWLNEGREVLPVSVNVSRYDLFRDSFFDVITGLMETYRLPLSLLRLEITESAFAQSSEKIIGIVKRLIDYGFTIEIDDFGSGYSSLNTLKDVPANILKLDMRFLENNENSSRGGNILESVIRMAKWLGMPVIAEGVETVAQADYLRSIGCFYVQGYLYARPMPVDEYERLAEKSDREIKMSTLETVETLDNNAFWDPKSMETLIFNSYVGGACIFEYVNGRIELLRVNEKYARELGGDDMTVEEALSFDIAEHMDEENLRRTYQSIENAIATDAESTCEICLTSVPRMAGRVYIRTSVRMIARAGTRVMLYCSIINMTSQRVTEQNEREATAQLQAIANNINGGVTAVTIDGNNIVRYLFSNDQFYRQLGYTREQFAAEVKTIFDLAHPDDRDKVIEETMRASVTGQPFSVTFRMYRRDGGIVWMQCNISIIHMRGIDAPVQIAVSSDITAQVMAEAKERQASERLQAIMENANSGIVAATLTNGQARIIFSNNHYYEMLGYTREEYDKVFSDGFGPVREEDRAWLLNTVNSIVPSEKPALLEYRVKHRDGREIWIQQRIAHTQFAGSDDIVQLSILNDITAEKLAEQRSIDTAAQLESIIQNIHGGVSAALLTDGVPGYIFVNDWYFAMFGYTREQFEKELPRGIVDLIHPDDLPMVIGTAENAQKTDQPFTLEYRARKRDGQEIWVRSNGSICHIHGHDAPVQLAVTNDITRERNDKRLIEESSEQLLFLNDTAHDLFAQTDAEEGFATVLQKTLAYFQGDRAYVVEMDDARKVSNNTYEVCAPGIESQMTLLRGIPYEATPFWGETLAHSGFIDIESVEAIGDDRAEEKRILTRQGIHSLVAVPLRRNGRLIGVVGVDNPTRHQKHVAQLQAIGDYIVAMLVRRDMSARIRSDHQSLLALMNDTPGGFVRMKMTADGQTTPVYFNKGFCDMMGMTQEELTALYGADSLSGVHPDDLAIVKNAIREMRKTGEIRGVKYRLRHGGGDYVWVMVFGRMTKGEMGASYLNIYYSDLSEQENKELSLRETLPVILKAMMASSSDLSFVKDKDFTYICCSRAFARMAGLRDENEIVGKTDFDLFDEALARRYREDDLKLVANGQSLVDYIEKLPSPDGSSHYSCTSKYLLHDAAGEMIGLYGVGRDITEEREAYAQLKLLTNNLPGGLAMYEVTPERVRILYFSDGFYTLTGYTKEEYAAMAQSDTMALIFKEDIPRIEEAVRSVLSGEDAFEYTYRAHCKNGGYRWLSLSGMVLERRKGSAIVNAVKLDITDRVRHDEALRMSEEQYRLALENSGSIIARYDVGDRSVNMTHNVATLFGMPEKVVDVPYAPIRSGLIAPETQDAYIEFYEGILNGHKKGNAVFHCMTAQGWRWLKAGYCTIFSNEGAPVSAILVMEDITTARAEKAAYQENEMVLQLVAEHSNRIIFRYDIATKTAYADKRDASENITLSVDTDVPESIIARRDVLPESVEDYRRVFREIDDGAPSGSAKVHMRAMDGSPHWVDLKYSVIFDADGAPKSAVLSFLDITESHEKEFAYERYLQTIDQKAVVEGVVLYVEADVTANLIDKIGGVELKDDIPAPGSDRSEGISYIARTYIEPEDRERYSDYVSRERLITAFSDGVRALSEDWGFCFLDGRTGYVRSELQMVQDPYTGHIKIYTLLRDITKEKHAALEVKKKAEQDGMTGLFNKATTESMIRERLATGETRVCALLIADLDNLKTINDSQGHAHGDTAIKLIGDSLRAQFRKGDIVGRVGGDEFAVFLDNCGTEAWLHSAMLTLMKRLSMTRIGEQGCLPLRGSIGIAMGVAGTESYDELFRRADLALYHVKRNGKNDFAFYRPEMEWSAYEYKAHNESEIWSESLFSKSELDHLMTAVASLYPLVISANLTQNSYYMMKYENYTTRACVSNGMYNELIIEGAATFHPDDRQGFLDAFSRENLLEAHARGERIVSHRGRQLGDDKIYRLIQTDVIFVKSEENGDVLHIALGREIPNAEHL